MRIELVDSQGIWIEIDEGPVGEGEREIGVREKLSEAISAADISQAISGFAANLRTQLAKLGVAKTTIEFGVSFAIESGKLINIIAKGMASSSIKVTLEWQTA